MKVREASDCKVEKGALEKAEVAKVRTAIDRQAGRLR